MTASNPGNTATAGHRGGARAATTENIPPVWVLTGPGRREKARWLQETIRAVQTAQLDATVAILASELTEADLARVAQAHSRLCLRRLVVPCACCPALADLPGHVRTLVASAQPDWLFIEVPVVSATGLLAEFDAQLGWPRQCAVRLDARWADARRDGRLSPFQFLLLEMADHVSE